eukprot:UN04511
MVQEPELLFLGLGLGLIGVICLGLSQILKMAEEDMMLKLSPLIDNENNSVQSDGIITESNAKEAGVSNVRTSYETIQSPGSEEIPHAFVEEMPLKDLPTKQKLTVMQSIFVCIGAAVVSCLWSPLSTVT